MPISRLKTLPNHFLTLPQHKLDTNYKFLFFLDEISEDPMAEASTSNQDNQTMLSMELSYKISPQDGSNQHQERIRDETGVESLSDLTPIKLQIDLNLLIVLGGIQINLKI